MTLIIHIHPKTDRYVWLCHTYKQVSENAYGNGQTATALLSLSYFSLTVSQYDCHLLPTALSA